MAVVGRAVFGELSGAGLSGLLNMKNGMANIVQSSINNSGAMKPLAGTVSAFAHPKAPFDVPSGIKSPMKRARDHDLSHDTFENDLENVDPLGHAFSPKKVKTNFGFGIASPRLDSVAPRQQQRAVSNADANGTSFAARPIRIPVSPKRRSYTLEAAVAAHIMPMTPSIKILETSTIWSPRSKTLELKAAWKKASTIRIYEDTQHSLDRNVIQHEMAQVALDKSVQKNYELEAVENMKMSEKLLDAEERAAKALAEARAERMRAVAFARNGGMRLALGELDAAGFYGKGLEASSHVLVESDDSLANRIAGAMARQTHEKAKAAAKTVGFSIAEDPMAA